MQDLVAYFRGLDEGVRLAVMTSLRVALILVIAWALQLVAAPVLDVATDRVVVALEVEGRTARG